MAAPATQNLTITRGDTETVTVNVTTDGSTPVNITGRTYTAQMRTSQDISAIAASFTCTVTDGAGGVVTCVLSATNCATLDPGFLYWDLQENASGTISTILAGTVTVLADVTR
ncbi:hypothetical protein UFOVP668_17 [uncultured Caudovirales phage]|jgi:hypothetical protein|uniref:Uncharacterized protein n=1 Tax=uncultured Caudovirales phage TaxID=2100421 RepID=A0A6J5NA30_9CAUD|nr:hypothetical protein UFOVP668_17 [uncultured Caudovirales phage]